MMDAVLNGFLERQFEEARALARDSDLLELVPIDGPPPQHYIASYRAKGLALGPDGQVVEAGRCDVGIWLPSDYLRRVEPAQVFTYLGPEPSPWHPNIRPPYICLHLRPGTPLVEILYSCYEIWTWFLYGTADEGLNHAAAQWARSQDPGRFPIDRRPLKRRELRLGVETATREARP